MKSRVCISHCSDCGKTYTNKFNMKRHYALAHLHENKFVCEFCGKSLSSKQNYKEHTYTHTGEKPFACPDCGVRYRQCSQLSVHKRVHRNAKKTSTNEFRELKVTFTQLTDMLDFDRLKSFDTTDFVVPKLFQTIVLPPLGQPNTQVRLSVYIFTD